MSLTQKIVDIIEAPDHQLAGAAALVWRRGELLAVACGGARDVEAQRPVERDTLFRIASMSKPITTVAALTLIEEGRFGLDDPITRWAPELEDFCVLRDVNGPLDDTVPAERPITFEDLLTHRSGITYGAFWPGPLGDAYTEALGADIDSTVPAEDWIARLGTLPLIDQPGATLHYGHSTDLLGLLIARMEDTSLDEVLRRRVFAPLGMKDTRFVVPREHQERCAKAYGFDADGRRIEVREGPGGSFLAERPPKMTFVSGGQGLWSTVDDYLAFARALLGHAPHILRSETLTSMRTNRLTPAQRASAEVGGMSLFAAGHGFGLGVAVVLEPDDAFPTICRGHAGTVGWPGGFGGWWQADPTDDAIAIFLTHNMVEREQLALGIGHGAFAAIAAFQRVASGA